MPVIPVRTSHRGLVTAIRLDNKVGEGGVGSVYKQTLKNDLIAVKISHRPTAPGKTCEVNSFVFNEAEICAGFDHPGIIKYVDHGEVVVEGSERAFFAREYVEGQSLYKRRIRKGPLPPPLSLGIAFAAAHALAYMHQLNFVHVDVKPDNILLADDGRKKMIGLSFSRLAGKPMPYEEKFDVIAGTPAFTSPRRLRGNVPLPSDDIYSLGLTFFETLSGSQLPFFIGRINLPSRNCLGGLIAGLKDQGIPGPLTKLMFDLTGAKPEGGFVAAPLFAHAGQVVEHIRQTPELSSLLTHENVFSG
jgi:serine/threonine protein kinase